jgi:hypothetical protein
VQLIDNSTGEPVELALVDASTGKRIGADHRIVRRIASEEAEKSYPFPETTNQSDNLP